MKTDKDIIQYRIPVWKVLSEFYLDTILNDEDYARIARVLNDSPYSFSEIVKIDLHEVFPVLQYNLFGFGQWSGFDEDWLIIKCQGLFARQKSKIRVIFHHILNLMYFWMRRSHFEKVRFYFREKE